MELIVMMFGAIFWPSALIAWLVACHFAVRKYGRAAKIARNVGVGVWIGLVLLIGYSLGRHVVLDEPLALAASDGDLQQVERLLDRGASPDATFEDAPALYYAAESGHTWLFVC